MTHYKSFLPLPFHSSPQSQVNMAKDASKLLWRIEGERGQVYNTHVHVKDIEAKQYYENSYYFQFFTKLHSVWWSSVNEQGLSEMCQ